MKNLIGEISLWRSSSEKSRFIMSSRSIYTIRYTLQRRYSEEWDFSFRFFLSKYHFSIFCQLSHFRRWCIPHGIRNIRNNVDTLFLDNLWKWNEKNAIKSNRKFHSVSIVWDRPRAYRNDLGRSAWTLYCRNRSQTFSSVSIKRTSVDIDDIQSVPERTFRRGNCISPLILNRIWWFVFS